MKVYFKRIASYKETEEINKASEELLKIITKDLPLEETIPLKVHFGEKGNKTFIEPKNFLGIIKFLKKNKIKSAYIETNVLYRGERTRAEKHKKLAKKHGFTQLPIIIADGEHGEDFIEVPINQKHFKTCKIGKEFQNYKQMIVISHFKGHIMAGFGGAIKQLAMGYASRGGKLEQHSDSKPIINPIACQKCMTCVKHCPTKATKITKIPHIDHKLCIGCAACIAVCPYNAVKINWLGLRTPNTFYEKIAEHALASHKKNNIYIQYVFNITKQCDCAGKEMKPFLPDLGILASLDPVAIDKATMDLLKHDFRGQHTLDYAEKIGLGSKEYELVEI